MPVQGSKKTKYHPTMRRKLLAVADVQIQQAQVVDKNGQERAIVIYRCGPDTFYADTMDGLFDVERRKPAPTWLMEALDRLPADRCFDHTGSPKAGGPKGEMSPPGDLAEDLEEDEVRGARQA